MQKGIELNLDAIQETTSEEFVNEIKWHIDWCKERDFDFEVISVDDYKEVIEIYVRELGGYKIFTFNRMFDNFYTNSISDEHLRRVNALLGA